jgi:hypothetical protein
MFGRIDFAVPPDREFVRNAPQWLDKLTPPSASQARFRKIAC